MTAEGCAEVYTRHLDDLLRIAFAGCKDAVQAVREAACIAIGQFAQYLQPEIISHYEQVLPHIFMVRLSLILTLSMNREPAHFRSAPKPL
jgi:hypothetical protein